MVTLVFSLAGGGGVRAEVVGGAGKRLMEGRNSALMLKTEVRAPQSDRKLLSPNALCSECCFMWVQRKPLENGEQGPQKSQCPQKCNGLNVEGGRW